MNSVAVAPSMIVVQALPSVKKVAMRAMTRITPATPPMATHLVSVFLSVQWCFNLIFARLGNAGALDKIIPHSPRISSYWGSKYWLAISFYFAYGDHLHLHIMTTYLVEEPDMFDQTSKSFILMEMIWMAWHTLFLSIFVLTHLLPWLDFALQQ